MLANNNSIVSNNYYNKKGKYFGFIIDISITLYFFTKI